MALHIFTKSPQSDIFSKEKWKGLVRKVLKKTRGPQQVTESVIRGLNNLGYVYHLNPNIKKIQDSDIIWVNESLDALAFFIKMKEDSKKIKLVVGPNLVVTPDDHNKIIFDPAIDIILQPSQWTKTLYEKYDSHAASKIHIWPAGVKDPYENHKMPEKEKYFIVYQKNVAQEFCQHIFKILEEKEIKVKIVKYGSFKNEDFLSILERARGMIYLSPSESQGLALQEAWIRDVPTLVWDKGFWKHPGIQINYQQISCPYLTPKSGLTFKNIEDFPSKLKIFMEHLAQFSARDYSKENLIDKVTTERFLDIIK